MPDFEITLDSHIRIKGLSLAWVEGLSRLASFDNEDKEVALREHVWGAKKMDDLLTLAEYRDDTLILPRGFLDELENILTSNGFSYSITDKTVWVEGDSIYSKQTKPSYTSEQSLAVATLLKFNQGRIILPPGRGKTVIALGAIFAQKQPTLVIVEKKNIAQQWVDRAKEHFNRDIGFIGDNKWQEDTVTVALIQTLHSRKDQLEFFDELENSKWFHKWSTIILDEQHHIPAETYLDIIQRFPAKKRWGISATVGKTPAKKRMSELVFGPIRFQAEEVDVKPEIIAIDTGFNYPYKPTHQRRAKNGKLYTVRNNYKPMITKLVDSAYRNAIIAKKIVDNKEHCNLVVSDRLNHLSNIHLLIRYDDISAYFLTGKESLDERMEVYEKADSGNCVIFSTIAGEALDIPRLDRLHMVYPRKNEEAIWQIIGRLTRTHPDKKDAIVYDYVDTVKVLHDQYKHRLRTLYQKRELKVQRFQGMVKSDLLTSTL